MSFTFAVGCRLWRRGANMRADQPGWLGRTLIVTRLEYPRDIVSLSECDPAELAGDALPKVRFTLLGAPSSGKPRATRFSFLSEAPPDARVSAKFVPATGDLQIRWKEKRPCITARFGAPMSESFMPSTATTLWTLAGVHLAWKGELLAGAQPP